MQLSNAQVLLTGASGGIGLALCAALCQEGAKVLAVARNTQVLQQISQQYPAQLQILPADLLNPADLMYVVEQATQKPDLNMLIHAAGLNHFALLEHQTAEQIQRLVQLNVTTPMLLTSALMEKLKSQPQAKIVNVGSIYGSLGFAGYTTYCATKFAVRGFSEALRRELADSAVQVLYVAPRATKTSMNSTAAQQLMQAMGGKEDAPEFVAKMIVEAIKQDKQNIYLGWPERGFVMINSILPHLVDQGVRKHLPLIRQLSRAKG